MVRKEDLSVGLSMNDRQEGMDFRSIEDGIITDDDEAFRNDDIPSLERNPTAESFYYADEASLYSIAENSHEWEEESDKPMPEKGGGDLEPPAHPNNTTAVTYHSQTSKEEEGSEGKSNESPRVTDGSQTTAPRQNLTNAGELKSEMGVELCYAPNGEGVVRSEEDHWLFYHHHRVDPTAYLRRRRRRTEDGRSSSRRDSCAGTRMMLTLWCLILLIGVICLSVAVVLFQNRAENRSASIASVEGDDTGKNQTTASSSAPTAAPISPGTPKPTPNVRWILSENFVHSAVKNCQGTRMFFNDSTIQGKVFDQLVQEVYSGAITTTESDIVEFAPHHTTNYLREKYSLNVLYLATNGPTSWKEETNWMTPTDPCNSETPWFGLECQASNATVAKDTSSCDASTVIGLHLNDNGLSGTLPMELCCLPCVQSIDMSNNKIGGDILWCINEIPTLEKLLLVNNSFGVAPPAVEALSVVGPP